MASGGIDGSPSPSLHPLMAEEAASSALLQAPAGEDRGSSLRQEVSSPPSLTGGKFLLQLLQRGPQSQVTSAPHPLSAPEGGRGEGNDDPAVAALGPCIPLLRPQPGDSPSALLGAHPHGSPPWRGTGFPGFHQVQWSAPHSEFTLTRPVPPPGFHHHRQHSHQYNNIASRPAGGMPSFSPPLGFQAGPFDVRDLQRKPVHNQHTQHQQQSRPSRRDGFPLEGGSLRFGSLVSVEGKTLSKDPLLPGFGAPGRGMPVTPDLTKRPVTHDASISYGHARECGQSFAASSFPGSNRSFLSRPSHQRKESGELPLQKKQGVSLRTPGKSEAGNARPPIKRDKDVRNHKPSNNGTHGGHTLEQLVPLRVGEQTRFSVNNEPMMSSGLRPNAQRDHSSPSVPIEGPPDLGSDVKERTEYLHFGTLCAVQTVQQVNNGDVDVIHVEEHVASERMTDSSEVIDEISEKMVNVRAHSSRGKDYRSDDLRGQHVLSQRMRYRQRRLLCRRNIGGFSPSFLAIYESLVPSDEEKAKQRHLLQSLEKLVIKEWPDARLHLYGSCANSFGVSNSDIDVCLAINDNDINKPEILLKLADILQSNNLKNVQALIRARVPIVKLMDPLTGLSCDICINNMLAVVNTKLLRDYAMIDARLRQLAFIVKHWAKTRGINDTYQGTLSSYAYVLMCIHFLQLRRPAILPCLQEMEATYVVEVDGIECAFFDKVEKLRDFGAGNRESIAEILWSFFSYWAYHHDYTNDVISVRTGGIISKDSKDWTRRVGNDRHLICIEDPFEVTHDLGRVVDKFTIKILREEFERAAEIMQCDPNPGVKLFEPYVRASERE